jgi:hypothetical protein
MSRESEKELQKLFDGSQEAARESVASVLRIARERGLEPQALLRATYQGLMGMQFGSLGVGASPVPRKGSAKSPK